MQGGWQLGGGVPPPHLPSIRCRCTAGRTRVQLKTTGEVFSLVPPTSKANNVILGGWGDGDVCVVWCVF